MSTKPENNKTEDQTVANSAVITKFKLAGDIAQKVLAAVVADAKAGANIGDLCAKGDKLVKDETSKVYNSVKVQKGSAFPTTVSVNDCVAHYSPLPGAETADLKDGDIVKIVVGAHIDGYPSIVADTVVVGGKPTPEVADALNAAHYATELALRTIKPGNKNWDVTKVVEKVAKDYDCTPMEGMLTQQHLKDEICGKKKIILNPSDQQKKDFETATFAENEVYGLDIYMVPGETGKTISKEDPTTVYKKNGLTYQLKLRTSRIAISEIQKKAGTFPFNLSILEDQKRARMGLVEPTNHGLVEPLDIVYSKSGKPVVQLFTTFALTKNGILKFAAPPSLDLEAVKSDKKVTDEKLQELLKTSLKTNKKKKKTSAAKEGADKA